MKHFFKTLLIAMVGFAFIACQEGKEEAKSSKKEEPKRTLTQLKEHYAQSGLDLNVFPVSELAMAFIEDSVKKIEALEKAHRHYDSLGMVDVYMITENPDRKPLGTVIEFKTAVDKQGAIDILKKSKKTKSAISDKNNIIMNDRFSQVTRKSAKEPFNSKLRNLEVVFQKW